MRQPNRSWRVDETYLRVAGKWTYLYRALDSAGDTIDSMLSPNRDLTTAKGFLRLALSAAPVLAQVRYHFGDDPRWAPPVCHDSSWPVSADGAVKWPDTRDQMLWVRRRVAAPFGITGPLAILWPDGCDATQIPAELFVNGVRVAAVGQMGPRRSVRIPIGSVWAEGYMIPEGSRGAVTAGLILNCLAKNQEYRHA